MKAPFYIGVTGHRDPVEQDIPRLRREVRTELLKLKAGNPGKELIMLNSVAAGGDFICGEEALRLGIALVCPLPMEAEEYRKDFNENELPTFESLLSRADRVFVSPHAEPEQDGRDYLYRQAGIYVSANSHVLLALWDGSPAKPRGCGTAEAVDFMRMRGGTVIHINTPRKTGAFRQSPEKCCETRPDGA